MRRNLSSVCHDPAMSDAITVTQLNNRTKAILGGSAAVNDIWVIGEISNLKKYGSGHYYFTLKDGSSEIRAVMFRGNRSRLDFEPQDAMKVMAFGSAEIYVERGAYQFVVGTMRKTGVGDLYLAFEALKKKLESEGLFEASRKRPLPAYPKTIGVVTSSTGAVIHDIITTSGRRFPADILLAPAQVQGEGAAESIAAGIDLLNRENVDVIIVGRGGGSLEDLWAFNEETVARAIASSRIPVISAVGHETDFTIADMVADVRAPTPTAAAELALRDKKEIKMQIDRDVLRLNRSLSGILEKMEGRFRILDSKLSPKRAEEKVGMYTIRVDDLSIRLTSSLKGYTERMRNRLVLPDSRLEAVMADRMSRSEQRVEYLSDRLEGLNPYRVLGRGYSFVTGADGKAITSASGMKAGSDVTIGFRDGIAEARVNRVEVRK